MLYFKHMPTNHKGFTLIELVIVIAMAAIISGLLLTALSPGNMVARSNDSKRLADIDALNKALVLALSDGELHLNSCEAHCNSATGTHTISGSGYVTFTITEGKTGLGKHISILPVDPVNDPNRQPYPLVFSFQADPENQAFELNVVLQSSKNAHRMKNDGGNNELIFEIGTDPGLDLID